MFGPLSWISEFDNLDDSVLRCFTSTPTPAIIRHITKAIPTGFLPKRIGHTYENSLEQLYYFIV